MESISYVFHLKWKWPGFVFVIAYLLASSFLSFLYVKGENLAPSQGTGFPVSGIIFSTLWYLSFCKSDFLHIHSTYNLRGANKVLTRHYRLINTTRRRQGHLILYQRSKWQVEAETGWGSIKNKLLERKNISEICTYNMKENP